MALKYHIVSTQTAVAAATIGAITVFAMYLYQKRKQKNTVPTVWNPIGKVKGLYTYPLKSGRRVELRTANCTEYGIISNHLRDRCLAVYKEGNNEYRTAKTYPKMVLIEVTAKDPNYICINAPGMETLEINISHLRKANTPDKISFWHEEKVFTIDCGDEAAQWFSKYILDSSCGVRLGFHDGRADHRRSIDSVYGPFTKVYPLLDSASMGLYSDLSSYMLMNQSSVDELNAKIQGESISVHYFRPNILVEGEGVAPYAEDNWDWIKIGDVVLQRVKPCARCILTTINPETGVKSINHEPLKTLKTYRKVKDLLQVDLEGQDPIMGSYMRLLHTGQIHVGETVFLGRN